MAVAIVSDRARKRLKAKHPWIFSNEIENKPQAAAGEIIEIQDRKGHYLATGYYNPHTLIAIRILSFYKTFSLPERVQSAYQFRRSLYSQNIYRLIYSESDGLPGLIVDRYEDTLVAQILTAAMERMREEILASLTQIPGIHRILFRNDSPYRELEKLPLKREWVYGEPLEKQMVETDGLKLVIDLFSGQKTGFFLDQQENRRRLKDYARGERMLDLFSYSGGWALYGCRAGMKDVTAVDSSAQALELLQENAAANQFNIRTIQADVFDFLRQAYDTPDRYDLIVLDPPAFAKSRRAVAEASRGYREINLRAMKLLAKNGILITCSCSQPVTTDVFLDILYQAAADSGRMFRIRNVLFQPPDHPVLLTFPESHYLKCVILELL